MQSPYKRPAAGANRRPALISCGLIGGMLVLLFGLWWTAAMKTPAVKIPNPVLPNPNAFDFYVTAGNALVGDKQIADAISTKPTVVLTLAQKEALVQQNVGVINTIHQGFAYPYVNPPARSFTTLFPYYAKFRAVTRLLSLQGQIKAKQGDWNGAVESYLDAIQMGKEMPHGSVMIGELVGVACQAIGRRPMWEAMDHLDLAQSRAAAARLERILGKNFAFADTLQEEKWCGQAALLEIFNNAKTGQALMSTPNSGDDSGSAATAQSLTLLLYLAYSKSRIMHDYTTFMDRSTEQAQKPYGLHLAPPPMPTDPINSTILPIFTQARMKSVESEAKNGLLLLTLALHAYRLEHGRYPASLTELAPAYLKKLPDDPFAQQGTFKYHIGGKSYTLYSVGPDGKDDDGTPIDDPKEATASNPNARYLVNERSVGDVVAGENLP